MEKALSGLQIKQGECRCRKWDFFEGWDKTEKPEKGMVIHNCEDITVYQKKMSFYYVRK